MTTPARLTLLSAGAMYEDVALEAALNCFPTVTVHL
jgi:hypothetical protein